MLRTTIAAEDFRVLEPVQLFRARLQTCMHVHTQLTNHGQHTINMLIAIG